MPCSARTTGVSDGCRSGRKSTSGYWLSRSSICRLSPHCLASQVPSCVYHLPIASLGSADAAKSTFCLKYLQMALHRLAGLSDISGQFFVGQVRISFQEEHNLTLKRLFRRVFRDIFGDSGGVNGYSKKIVGCGKFGVGTGKFLINGTTLSFIPHSPLPIFLSFSLPSDHLYQGRFVKAALRLSISVSPD